MPEQNQPIQGAFGDIYSAALPETQQAAQQQAQLQLYQNRMAQQQKVREEALFDRMQNQEITKARSADAPDIANAYSQWRNADIAAETYKGTDAQQYNKLSQASNQAYAQAAQKVAKSAEMKNLAVQMQEEQRMHPDRYSDNFADLQHAMLDTPYDGLKNVKVGDQTYDLTNRNSYLYQGANMPKYSQMLTGAYGKPQKITVDEGPIDANGIQNRQSTYSYGSSPAQVKSTIAANLATDPKGERNARYILSTQYGPDAITNINNAYHNLPPEYWQRSGIGQPQSVEPANPESAVDLLSSLEAKKYAINNQPRLEASKNVTNLGKQMFTKARIELGNQEQMAAVRQGYTQANIKLHHDYNKMDSQNQAAFVDNYVSSHADDAIKEGTSAVSPDGEVEYRPKTADQNIITQLATGKGKTYSKPDDMAYNADGSKVRGIFYMRDAKGNKILDPNGGYKEDPNKGQWQDAAGIKVALGKSFGSTPEAKAYVAPVATPPQEKEYSWKGQTFTTSQLLKKGLTQDEIDAAIKIGIIK